MPRNPNDDADRKAYRQYVSDRVETGQSPSFWFLAGPEEGKFHSAQPGQFINGKFFPSDHDKAGAYSDQVADGRYAELQWQASHCAHDEKQTNFLAIEDATTNMSDGGKYEKQFELEKRTVEIEGLAITEHYARRLEADGFLKPGTVDAATPCLGWTADRGILGMDGQPLQVSSEPTKSPDELNDQHIVRGHTSPNPQPSQLATEFAPPQTDALTATQTKEPDPVIH